MFVVVQEGFLILQLALHCVEDVPTLFSISSVSVACCQWVKGHAGDYLPIYISHELLRQEARWERALTRQHVILRDHMQLRVRPSAGWLLQSTCLSPHAQYNSIALIVEPAHCILHGPGLMYCCP
jgi:hypothetical protein